MREKKYDRRSSARHRPAAVVNPNNQQGIHLKEYCYVFRLSSEEVRVLNKHRDDLIRGAAGFAEIYYDYLFENPDISDLLYAYERRGGRYWPMGPY